MEFLEYRLKAFETIFLIALIVLLGIGLFTIYNSNKKLTKSAYKKEEEITELKNNLESYRDLSKIRLKSIYTLIDTNMSAIDMKYDTVLLKDVLQNRLVIRMNKDDCNCTTEGILRKIEKYKVNLENLVLLGNFKNPKYLKTFLQKHNALHLTALNTPSTIVSTDTLLKKASYVFYVDNQYRMHFFQPIYSQLFNPIAEDYFRSVVQIIGKNN